MTSGVSLSHSELTYDLKDGIVTITINRPHKKNALTEELLVLLDKM